MIKQPEDPASMIITLVRAYKYTDKEEYKNLAIQCFNWFLELIRLVYLFMTIKSGGCHDGLQPKGINRDQGAESLISYLMGRVAVQALNE